MNHPTYPLIFSLVHKQNYETKKSGKECMTEINLVHYSWERDEEGDSPSEKTQSHDGDGDE